jgi:hypothetical protein
MQGDDQPLGVGKSYEDAPIGTFRMRHGAEAVGDSHRRRLARMFEAIPSSARSCRTPKRRRRRT